MSYRHNRPESLARRIDEQIPEQENTEQYSIDYERHHADAVDQLQKIVNAQVGADPGQNDNKTEFKPVDDSTFRDKIFCF